MSEVSFCKFNSAFANGHNTDNESIEAIFKAHGEKPYYAQTK